MRIMDQIICENDLKEELEDALVDETGNTGFWLGFDSGEEGLDESSDQEDALAEISSKQKKLLINPLKKTTLVKSEPVDQNT